MYELYIDGVLFPVTPGSLNIKINNKNKTITLINEGEVNLIKSPGLSDITIPELLLPINKYPFSCERERWEQHIIFRNWRNGKIRKTQSR